MHSAGWPKCPKEGVTGGASHMLADRGLGHRGQPPVPVSISCQAPQAGLSRCVTVNTLRGPKVGTAPRVPSQSSTLYRLLPLPAAHRTPSRRVPGYLNHLGGRRGNGFAFRQGCVLGAFSKFWCLFFSFAFPFRLPLPWYKPRGYWADVLDPRDGLAAQMVRQAGTLYHSTSLSFSLAAPPLSGGEGSSLFRALPFGIHKAALSPSLREASLFSTSSPKQVSSDKQAIVRLQQIHSHQRLSSDIYSLHTHLCLSALQACTIQQPRCQPINQPTTQPPRFSQLQHIATDYAHNKR